MAREEVGNVRVDPLGDDDAEELAAQYRTETRMVGVGKPVGQSQASALIVAPKPISQVEPDHWHTKADKSTITAADLEAIREKYQIPAEARKEGEALKKKKKKRSAPEGAADESGAKRSKVAPAEVEVPVAKDTPEVMGVTPTLEVVEAAPTVQIGVGLTETAPSGREQTKKGPAPQEGGVCLATAIYHARAVAGRLEGEEGLARAGVDRLAKIVEETALRSASGFNETDLLRGICSAEMEELEDERVKAEKEKGRLVRELEIEKAKAMAEMESLRKGMEEERATAAAERGALQRELDEERAKAASERAAYPDLCVAVVEQYKGSPEFQMAVDAAVARNLAGQESGGWAHQGRLLELTVLVCIV
ncbi:uncharacterized protein LOC114307784 [Camellia sinensis]|uniref:uncharacterized protein LOC114307784 n=1 Tax=Camellia sinensis TaxID=4442 RepID=UPI001035956C|nr:uncharacterized protein LOC114307784 [Camellia sinensis]